MASTQDIAIVRQLAAQVAEIAALPVQEEKRRLWRKLNALKPERPMVMIDQVCWNEMNVNDELTLRCTDEECRGYEWRLRATLFQWKHFPVDMVVEPYMAVAKAVWNDASGVTVKEDISVSDPSNSVVGHKYLNQFATDEDLEKLQTPRMRHDAAETARRISVARELFDGVLEVRESGMEWINLSLWDPISQWMGVEGALWGLVDRPEYMHKLVGRLTDCHLSMLDQLENLSLLPQPQPTIHCTGAYSDELPAAGFNPAKPRTKDIWMFGLAQMFATVSPAMFEEFEVAYASKICERFGLVYYGCCDPLDKKMTQVRKIPNVRKVSMSPWVDQELGASEIGRDFVYSRKPNPALLAWDRFDIGEVRNDLMETRRVCTKNGCPLEIILKDISTVRYEPQRLFDWGKAAMEIACG